MYTVLIVQGNLKNRNLIYLILDNIYMRKTFHTLLGILLGMLFIAAVPVFANSAQEVVKNSVVYKKVVSIQKGLKNPLGPVRIKDNLKVTGNLDVDGTSNITVNASDVRISSTNSATGVSSFLESKNLQNALDNELAIDLESFLPGTTWAVSNTTSDTTYYGYTGQITFDDTALTIDSGRVAAFGLTHPDSGSFCTTVDTTISYDMFANNLMYVSWSTERSVTTDEEADTDASSAVATIFANSKDTIGLVGAGGCGEVGTDRISVLTRVE